MAAARIVPVPDPDQEKRILLTLAAFLANGIDIEPGSRFPIGWDDDGQRLHEIATHTRLHKARALARHIMAPDS